MDDGAQTQSGTGAGGAERWSLGPPLRVREGSLERVLPKLTSWERVGVGKRAFQAEGVAGAKAWEQGH